jgi:hypothetical protein
MKRCGEEEERKNKEVDQSEKALGKIASPTNTSEIFYVSNQKEKEDDVYSGITLGRHNITRKYNVNKTQTEHPSQINLRKMQ